MPEGKAVDQASQRTARKGKTSEDSGSDRCRDSER